MAEIQVSEMDVDHLQRIRENVRQFMRYASEKYARKTGKMLDIAPQVHEGAQPFFGSNIFIETFDIDPNSGCTYIGDICTKNEFLDDETFDYITCTEVLEHTLQPFDAVNEIWRILKFEGFAFISVPFNFRIHGPLPDCWRFTEHGLRTLLSRFKILELNQLETPDRDLMPIHYTIVVRKSKQ